MPSFTEPAIDPTPTGVDPDDVALFEELDQFLSTETQSAPPAVDPSVLDTGITWKRTLPQSLD